MRETVGRKKDHPRIDTRARADCSSPPSDNPSSGVGGAVAVVTVFVVPSVWRWEHETDRRTSVQKCPDELALVSFEVKVRKDEGEKCSLLKLWRLEVKKKWISKKGLQLRSYTALWSSNSSSEIPLNIKFHLRKTLLNEVSIDSKNYCVLPRHYFWS